MTLLHIHWFKFKFRKGANLYFECRCGKRKVKSDITGYSPIDRKWLQTKGR